MGSTAFLLLIVTVGVFCSARVSCFSEVWKRQADKTYCDTTPTDIRESFISNCTQLVTQNGQSVCNQAWDSFSQAFARRDPATVVAR